MLAEERLVQLLDKLEEVTLPLGLLLKQLSQHLQLYRPSSRISSQLLMQEQDLIAADPATTVSGLVGFCLAGSYRLA